MAAKEFPLSVVIKAIDKVTAPMRAIQGAMSRFGDRMNRMRNLGERMGLPVMTAAAGRLGSALGDLGRRAGMVAGAIGGIGAAAVGLGFVAARSLVKTASEFENFMTTLETIEGSSAKAAKSMSWVTDFATKTPYELSQVTDAFVKLKASGMDPTQGLLRSVGDATGSLNKDLMQGVEAIIDAANGENERLKEAFNIRAKIEGNSIKYFYTDLATGAEKTATANRDSRKEITATLQAILAANFAGGMEKKSKTWAGMISNLGDHWEQFKSKVMKSGAFDALKERLGKLLETLDKMAKSGAMDKLAEVVGKHLVNAITAVWNAGTDLYNNWDKIKAAAWSLIKPIVWLFKTFGAFKVIVGALATVAALVLIPAIAATVIAIKMLGVAIMTTPLGWILAGIAALAYAAYKVYENWGPITEFFGTWWKSVKDVFGAVAGFIDDVWSDVRDGFKDGFINGIINLWKTLNPVAMIVRAFTELLPKVMAAVAPLTQKMQSFFRGLVPDWAKGALSGGKSDVLLMGAASTGQRAAAAQQSHARVTVDLNNLPPGSRVRADHTGRPDFELNQGRAFGPFGV
jgi:hypothetical protein